MSSARQGAVFALKVVLSWYENIDLRQLRTLRDGSKWTSDPACVELRKKEACSLAECASVDTFFGDLNHQEGSGESISGSEEEDEEKSGEEQEEFGDDIISEVGIPTSSPIRPDASAASGLGEDATTLTSARVPESAPSAP